MAIVPRPDLSDIGRCPPGANRCQFHWSPCKDEEKGPKLKVEEMHQKLPENKNLFFHLVVGLARYTFLEIKTLISSKKLVTRKRNVVPRVHNLDCHIRIGLASVSLGRRTT